MQEFVLRYYTAIGGVLLLAIVGLSFTLGYKEGIREVSPAVVLSCSADVLSKLTIPTTQLSLGQGSTTAIAASTKGAYVGSKNGTKYYTPGCTGLRRINPANYIWFKDKEDAQLQGYSAASC